MIHTANDIIIFEGANCTGKSTISQLVHLRTKYSLFLKLAPSPFYFEKEDGDYEKNMYYQAYKFIENVPFNTIILDRFFYSEYIYSEIYKKYKIDYFQDLIDKICGLNRKIFFILLTSEFNTILGRVCERRQVSDKDSIYGIENEKIALEYIKSQELFVRKFNEIDGCNLHKMICSNDSDISIALKTISQFIYG